MSSVLRRLFTPAAAAVLVSLFATSAASAAARPVTFDVFIGDSCVFGRARNDSFLKVVIRDRSGNQKGRGAVEADSQGYWQACMSPGVTVLPGDTINARVFDTTQSRTFTVPLLTGKVDRGTNVVSGKAPADTTVELEAFDFRWDYWGDSYDVIDHVTATGGSYSHDFDADGVNIRGGASVVVRWTNGSDTVRLGRFQIAPYITFQLGHSDVAGASAANGHVHVSLTSGSTRVAAADGTGSYGDTTFFATFADGDGEPYVVKGGEMLRAPALGAVSSWRIPQIDATADLAHEFVSGTCFANGRVIALAQNPNGFDYGLGFGNAAANGHFSIDLSDQLNIRKGYRVVALCYSDEGDEVVQETTA
jgi:hypothetical protein